MSVVICKQCGRENKSHFKYCLGCGIELKRENVILKPEPTIPPTSMPPAPDNMSMKKRQSLGNAPTMAATSNEELNRMLKEQGIDPDKLNNNGDSAPPAAAGQSAPPPANSDQDSASFTPETGNVPPPGGFPPPAQSPGEGPSMQEGNNQVPVDNSGGKESSEEIEMADTVLADDISKIPNAGEMINFVTCNNCGNRVPRDNKFCGNCGNNIQVQLENMEDDEEEPQEIKAAAVAKLIVQKPDGTQEVVLELPEGESILGRETHDYFEEDYYLSPQHIQVFIQNGKIEILDLESLNGTYFKLSQEEEIEDGNVFRIGTEVLRFKKIQEEKTTEDDTKILGSPNFGVWGKLELITGKGIVGRAYSLTGEMIKIGREEGDITYPEDGYVSGEHMEINKLDDQVFLIDLNSSNGSYLKISSKRELMPGTPLLMGYQLYKFELI
ncbi:MAG: FHA domain-containing protein [Deltaproteobacteria bacterium]|nr:FHA domain-containing protein [Deltaproteobacteria bacterium]